MKMLQIEKIKGGGVGPPSCSETLFCSQSDYAHI